MSALTVASPKPVAARANLYQALDRWVAFLDRQVGAQEITEATRNTYRRGVDAFIVWVEGQNEVSEEVILDWKADLLKRYRPNTVNTWLAGLRSFFDWAIRARLIAHNPAAGIKGSGRSRGHTREPLTDEEMVRVLALPDRSTPQGKRDYAMLALFAYTAARQVELHRANVDGISTRDGQMTLRIQGKGRDEEDELVVLAKPQARSALLDWLAERGDAPGAIFTSLSPRSRGRRLSLRAIRGLVKSYFRAAGIVSKKKTTHSLRHTAVTNALKHGAPLQKAQSMARHKNIATTMIYAHETDRVRNPAEQFIDYGDQPTPKEG